VLHLVDCSLLVPPHADPDGRSRYVMLETLRGYGRRLLAEAGEDAEAAATLAGYALGVAGEAAAGLQAGVGEAAGARWLDAEDATMRQVLAWATDHDAVMALRLAVALAPWWFLRGRSPGGYPLLRDAAGHAEVGSDAWCTAQIWLGRMALYSADPTGALGHFTAVRDAVRDGEPSLALADGLAGRSAALANLGRFAEAFEDGHRAVDLARELGYPATEAGALASLSFAAYHAGDFDGAAQLARQGQQIPADIIPGLPARACSMMLTAALTETGDLDAAERSCAAGLAQARDAGDMRHLVRLLNRMAALHLRAGRAQDAAHYLRESLQIAGHTGDPADVFNGLDWCGYLCAATDRAAEAVTVWAARAALSRQHRNTRPPALARRRDEPLARARRALGEARAQAAEDRGAAMSLATAAEYALTLTAPVPRQPPPTSELARLSPRERELVTLIARGRTDAQIAAHLFISIRTVASHLDRIRAKTGCRRRADLTRLALTAGLA